MHICIHTHMYRRERCLSLRTVIKLDGLYKSKILKFLPLREAQRGKIILPSSFCKTQTQLFWLFIHSFSRYTILNFLTVWSLGNVGAASDRATAIMREDLPLPLVYSLLGMPGPHRPEWAPASVMSFTRSFTQLLTSGLLVIINSILTYHQLRIFLPQFSGQNERSYGSGSSKAVWNKLISRSLSTGDEKCKVCREHFISFGKPRGVLPTWWAQ